MNFFVISGLIVLFFLISFLPGRLFNRSGVQIRAQKLLTPHQMLTDDLHYSLEHLIYFVHVPSHDPQIAGATRQDLYIRKDYLSYLFPRIAGLHIYLRTKDGYDQLIAYLEIDKIGLPQLSEYLIRGVLTREQLTLIATAKATHAKTMKEILDHVYSEIRA
jgi:hypothetical protein